ncbi:MAG: DEAD/DEAH box helicase family protein [Bacteroidales bacterium]|nr:DEAD/DEAH box helicase family protein [Bacteroidales bacterium]
MAKKNNKTKLSHALVLNQYILNLFGVTSLEALSIEMKDSINEGYDDNNVSNYYHVLISKLFHNSILNAEILYEYDQNIVSHTKKISEKRIESIKWKYFQYLSLLFTEIYLDKYFSNKEELKNSLNEFIDKINNDNGTLFPELRMGDDYNFESFTDNDLNKLAFWNATGSGKTLLMHVNILQYLHYLKKQKQENQLNRIILLTPNEGLSKQHLGELNSSGLEAQFFSKGGRTLYSGHLIEIIDIHKLEENEGDKTVAVGSFEGNNLVLVDEGHRGSSGEEWRQKRNLLCENGFSFEYSATFGQAVSAASGTKKEKLIQEYSKCTIFDYSYKYFYNDGYGKDYHILNLNETWNEHTTELYLTACLLSYYQQLKIFKENSRSLELFLIEKPLWIFVGSKVTAVRTENKKQVSDVIRILTFLSDFVKNEVVSINYLDRLMTSHDGLLDKENRSIFSNSFTYLLKKRINSTDLYKDILFEVFNSSISGALLHLDNLKGAEGEIGVRIGDAEYFSVINVGDDSKLLKLCEDNGILVSDKEFSSSLFHGINKKDSTVNVLIGSKKFTEGWSSWRVSTMGLMNIGRGEGSEIIQLFGRGVRLKGYQFSLKRSTKLDIYEKPDIIPEYLPYLETINIFGIRADYMQQFKEYLEEEGLPNGEGNTEEISIIPTITLNDKKLKILKIKDGIDFKKDVVFDLYPPKEDFSNVVLDWYPKVQILQSSKFRKAKGNLTIESNSLNEFNLAFINWDNVFFELQKYKNERSWYNISIRKEMLQELFFVNNWYTLYIPKEELELSNFEQTFIWQEIVTTLSKNYVDKVYNYEKNKYLSQYLSTEILDSTHPNFIEKYQISINKEEDAFIERIKILKDLVESKKFKEDYSFGNFSGIFSNQHLYQPLVYFKSTSYSDTVKVMPTQLNEGEKDFVNDLKKYYKDNNDFFKDKELYLLRNLSKKGIGFFEANNFFPDFVLWLIKDNKQYIKFIDPKGLRQVNGFENPKIKFSEVIQTDIRPKIKDEDISLESFIVSNTSFYEIKHWQGASNIKEFNKHNVYFQKEQEKTYIHSILNS